MPNTGSGPTSCSSKRSPTTAKFGHRHGALHRAVVPALQLQASSRCIARCIAWFGRRHGAFHRAVVPALQVHASSRCFTRFGHRHDAEHRAVVPVLQVLHLRAASQGLVTATVHCTAQSCQSYRCKHRRAASQDSSQARHLAPRSPGRLAMQASSRCATRFPQAQCFCTTQSCQS